jgi:hypothetical protein
VLRLLIIFAADRYVRLRVGTADTDRHNPAMHSYRAYGGYSGRTVKDTYGC